MGGTPNKACVRPTIVPQRTVPREGELLPLQVGGSSSSGEQGRVDDPEATDSMPNEPVREELGERVEAKAKIRPVAPSAKEIAEHEVSHYPYREWCRYCVASAGRRDGHKRV